MNYITGSFSPAVSKSTVRMPVDQNGAPIVVDEDQIKVSGFYWAFWGDDSYAYLPIFADVSLLLRDVQRHVSFLQNFLCYTKS